MKPRVLILLPCNPGAKRGNYWLGLNWRMARNAIKRISNWHDYAEFEYAAVEQMGRRFKDGDAIVGAWEMEKMEGHDEHPNDSDVTREELAALIRNGWHKFMFYDHVFVWLNVKRYREAFIDALTEERGFSKFHIFDAHGSYKRISWGAQQFGLFVIDTLRRISLAAQT